MYTRMLSNNIRHMVTAKCKIIYTMTCLTTTNFKYIVALGFSDE